ncbi:HAD-IC family P-type ATPase [Myxococcota bacterium]|nr:HAD-IC family P-type ATPase [Myxococcota bacterium]
MVASPDPARDLAPAALSERRWHALHAAEVVSATASDASTGLTAAEAAARLERFGPNALPEPKRRTLAAVFFGQFKSPLIALLFGAAALALAFGHAVDAGVITVVVLLNAVIGAFQEGRAERSLAALRRLSQLTARVVRDGVEVAVEARMLVPGDVIVLQAGDAVPADARLLEGAALQLAEAALTGESQPVPKSLPALDEGTPLADRHNMVHAGTHVAAGRARAVVVATGLATEIGHISTLTETATEPPTPLERRIARFGRAVLWAAAGLFVLILSVGLFHGLALEDIVLVAISQVVGMVPEGLPVAMTIALAVGVQRMARRQAVVRRLSAVETLGSTTVICTDKTGTLTCNEMTVTALVLPGGDTLSVSGTGYAPEGMCLRGDASLAATADPALEALLTAGVLCNDAHLLAPTDDAPDWRPLGDPTEVALLTVAVKAGLVPDALRAAHPRMAELPFDAASSMMATQHEGPAGPYVLVKGAPEAVARLCADVDPIRVPLAAAVDLAARGLRVLAFARIDGAVVDGARGFAAFTGRGRCLGLTAQVDPPRPQVARAVARCRAAGIRPVMVTGDHVETGLAIARQLDIARDGDLALDGRALEALDDDALTAQIDRVAVFARVHPAQKLRIIEAWQRRGQVVAMTGDGVNDAPALVRADVGVAMGRSGTEVAKEAADIVIGDDDFSRIVAAVEEGRVVYRNIKKAVLLLFSTAAGEVAVLLAALLAGLPPPFAAVQILWNNLVTEGLITVNLVLEPAEGDEMRRPPIPPDEPLLTPLLLRRMAIMVPAIVAVTLGWYFYRTAGGLPVAQVQTETFTLLAICEWYNVLNCRSETASAFDAGILRNPWLVGGLLLGNALQFAVVFWAPLGGFFRTVPIEPGIAVVLGLLGSVVLLAEALRKRVARRAQRAPA